MKTILAFLALVSTSFGGLYDNMCRVEQVDPTSTFTFYNWWPPLATGKDGVVVWDHTLNGGIGSTITANLSTDFVLSGGTVSLAMPTASKRRETYSGTTGAAGTVTVTFATAFAVAPNIQANIIGATDTQNLRITSVTATGFTVLVRNRTDVVGLLPTWANVNGANVDILITEK